MPIVSIVVNRLKIVDCADDDEDMKMNLSIYVVRNGREERVFSRTIDDVYVEEQGKIGNESKCVFFTGERVERVAGVDEVQICAQLNTLDGDGFNWGGDHVHRKAISSLAVGERPFIETKAVSSSPNTQGEYELSYTIIRHD